VIEKAICLCVYPEGTPFCFKGEAPKGPHRGGDSSTTGMKGAEIVSTFQDLSGLLHDFKIQWGGDVMYKIPIKKGALGPIPEGVPVPFGLGRILGMEPFWNGPDRANQEIFRKQGVQGPQEGRSGQGGADHRMSDLALRVDSTIGSTGRDDTHWASCDLLKGPLEGGLDGAGVFLTLPTGEASALVGERQFQSPFRMAQP